MHTRRNGAAVVGPRKPANAIALVVAFLVTGAALRARFRHDDAYDGPPGVQASPYVGVA